MNNQLLEKQLNHQSSQKTTGNRLAIVITVLSCLLIWWLLPISEPYVQEVLSFEGNSTRGEAIFQVNCASCHGLNGTGNVGPSLVNVTRRKSNTQIIKQVIGGKTPPMPEFQPSSQDMADLLSYLHLLEVD